MLQNAVNSSETPCLILFILKVLKDVVGLQPVLNVFSTLVILSILAMVKRFYYQRIRRLLIFQKVNLSWFLNLMLTIMYSSRGSTVNSWRSVIPNNRKMQSLLLLTFYTSVNVEKRKVFVHAENST
jgi:hypothetical protein